MRSAERQGPFCALMGKESRGEDAGSWSVGQGRREATVLEGGDSAGMDTEGSRREGLEEERF